VDPDAFWHVKTGEYIVESRSIPRTDIFSRYGQQEHLPWLPHEWLFDIALYGLWNLGGFQLVYVVTSLAYACIAPLVFLLTWMRSRRYVLGLILAVIAIAGCAHFIAPRPQVVTFPLLVGLAVLLERRQWPWALALTLVGVNLHGGLYPLFLLVIAFYTIPGRLAWLAAALPVVLVQPLGVKLIPYPFFAFDTQMNWFKESMPTVPAENLLFVAALLAFVLLVDRTIVPRKVLVASVALVLLGLKGVRHIVFTYLLVAPALAPYLIGDSRKDAEAPGAEPDAPAWMDRALAALLLIGALMQVAGAQGTPLDVHASYPAGAVDYLKQHEIVRIWNDWGEGGYLIYRGVPSFVDGRADPFSPFFDPTVTLAHEYGETYLLAADIRPFLEKYGITHMLVRHSAPLFQVVSQSRDFERIYTDESHAIFAYEPGIPAP
jgi:hypothetical protein